MIWIRRLFFLPGLAVLALILSYFAGYEALPSGAYEWALILAIGGGLALLILLRLFAVVALGMSIFFGLALLISISLMANYFLFERERDRWFNNQNERPIQLPTTERDRTYLRTLGIEPTEWAPLDWFAHTRTQASTGLSSQQLGPATVGKPVPVKTEQEVWLDWLGQLMMLFTGLTSGVLLGYRRNSGPPRSRTKDPEQLALSKGHRAKDKK